MVVVVQEDVAPGEVGEEASHGKSDRFELLPGDVLALPQCVEGAGEPLTEVERVFHRRGEETEVDRVSAPPGAEDHGCGRPGDTTPTSTMWALVTPKIRARLGAAGG
eukprot:jgi/Tetstr1/431348/TSEL_021039.t1